MDKTLVVEGARISYCIWEVQGIYIERRSQILSYERIWYHLWLWMWPKRKIVNGLLFYMIIYAGDGKSEDQLPMACMDSVAILIMFDLTSRCTLNRYLLCCVTFKFKINSSFFKS